ncbi:hypothetical protein BD408DRAFT_447495 [Parasitella parasitica]|nr:hypothetical protein BD408DRAFT_447495 [Parasitella parasitica]
MRSMLPSTLFSSKNAFAQMLPSLMNNHESIVQISQHLTADPAIFENFSLIFLRHLVDHPLNIEPIVTLTCFSIYFLKYLADNEKDLMYVVGEARTIMFSYCLKIRNTRQDLDDIEIYHVLYSILDQCAPLASLSWQKELDSLSLEKSKRILQNCDDLIESYIRNPSDFPIEFLECNTEQALEVTIRFSLFNILFGSKMKPLRFKDSNECFQFSDTWIELLSLALHSPLHAKFNVVVQLTERALWNLEIDRLEIQSSQAIAFDICSSSISNQQEFEKTFRECLQSLQIAHPMYISFIVYSLIQLILYARTAYNDDSQFQNHINQMSQAVWLEIYQSLLGDAVFEVFPCEQSPTIAKLFKVAACYIQFRLALDMHNVDFPVSIWDHYYLQRSIFLKSTRTIDSILLIEKVVFTSTCAFD